MNFIRRSNFATRSCANERSPRSDAALSTQRFSLTCRRCGWSGPEHARYCANCGLRLILREACEPRGFRELMRQGRRLRQRGPAWQHLAIRSFREALARSSRNSEPCLEIARTYRLAGRPIRARRWYRRAIRRSHDCIDAWLEGAGTLGPYSYFRRARWLARAVALRSGDTLSSEQLNRCYARLTSWQRWWIDRMLRPAASRAAVEPCGHDVDARTC